jgi:DNA repair exonuclease SbcCD ATPase subunit
MINFRYVKYKNLLSSGNYWTEIRLDENQNTLIVGTNGAGKSTMLDALCFSLFGKPFREINKPLLVNSINQKECLVEVSFDANGKSYRILRGIKPNVFEIWQDGVLINQESSNRDYQDILEKSILKLTYKSFKQIVILGSASFTPFMQLSSADRRAIIEDLLDITIFSTMNGIIKDKMSNNKDLTANKKTSIGLSLQKYELQKKHIDELKQNNEEKVQSNLLEIANNQTLVTNLSNAIDTLLVQAQEIQVVVNTKSQVEGKIKQLNKLETQIENNLTKYRKDIVFFSENDNCPTCRQSIETTFKTGELERLNKKATECSHGLTQLETKLLGEQAIMNQIAEKQKEVQAIQIKIASHTTSIAETQKYIVRLTKEIEDLQRSKTNTDKEEKELQDLKDNLAQEQEELKELLEEKTYYEVAAGLLKDTGIKTKIIKQYMPIINKMVNKYLVAMDFFVNFNLDESFKETIKSRHRDEFGYNSFSEGEKQRIDMALMLTWRAVAKLKNSANTNLLILDEVFDSSLDNNGTEYLMNILHMLEGVNLFVISHKGDILQDKFSNVIRFDKVKNFSRIVK